MLNQLSVTNCYKHPFAIIHPAIKYLLAFRRNNAKKLINKANLKNITKS